MENNDYKVPFEFVHTIFHQIVEKHGGKVLRINGEPVIKIPLKNKDAFDKAMREFGKLFPEDTII